MLLVPATTAPTHYLPPTTLTPDLVNVVRWDAFLEALGNLSLHVRIVDKVPTTIEEALHIALNLEALDHSWDVDLKVMAEHQERTTEEVKKKKDKYAKVAAQPIQELSCQCHRLPPCRFLQTFSSCTMHSHSALSRWMQWDVTELKQPPQPAPTPYVTPCSLTVPFGGPCAVLPPSYPTGSFGPMVLPLPMVLPGMAPIVMPAPQLVDQAGWANAQGPGPAVARSMGSHRSGPPRGPCLSCLWTSRAFPPELSE